MEGQSKFKITISINEEGNENNISLERNCNDCYVTSSDVMTAVLDAMNGLSYHLPYEEELQNMIEDARPSV